MPRYTPENMRGSVAQAVKAYVGKPATWDEGKLMVDVTIEDIKWSFGSFLFLITPLAGSGTVWVHESKVSLWADQGGL